MAKLAKGLVFSSLAVVELVLEVEAFLPKTGGAGGAGGGGGGGGGDGGGAPVGAPVFSCITGKLLFGKTLFRYSEGLTRSFSPFLLGNLGGTKGRTGVPLALGSSRLFSDSE